MENSKTSERFTPEEMGGMRFSIDKIANAIMAGIPNETGKTKSFNFFAEAQTDFDFDEYRNTLDAENERIDQEIQQLEQKKKLIDGWWKSIEYYRDALVKACEKINSQENDIATLKQQLVEEQKQREKHERMSARLMEITKEDADLKVQLAAQRELYESTARQLAEEKRQKSDLEMKLNEMSKLSAGMAKKAEEENLLKALRTYVNRSKKKTSDKRAFIKSAVLEIAMQNGLKLPDDLADTIDNLDDEQAAEPRTVVNGDLVQDKHVEHEVNNVASGATGVTINKKQS